MNRLKLEARASVTLSQTALLQNYQILREKVSSLNPRMRMLPMVKANAYGHGAIWAAKALAKQKHLHGFGVATFSEGVQLRMALRTPSIPILVFSECAPWTSESLSICKKFNLEPVLSEIVSLLEFQRQRGSASVPAHVEINTGMNRMGIPFESLPLLRFIPKSIFTHLADADAPKSKLTQLQMQGWSDTVKWVKSKYPHTLLHFSNSSAIWNSKQYPMTQEMDLVRPGLSLYGIRPFEKAKDDRLKRVMTYSAPILNRIYLNPGDQVGYGGLYTCRKKNGEWVSVLGAGYADGVFRSLSTKGIGVYEKSGKRVQFLGRVSMDLCAVQGTPESKVGDRVVLWGDEIDPYQQANLAGTIPYEITTRIGETERVTRNYV